MFAEKQREPRLSEFMSNTIKRSRHEIKSANYPLDYTVYFKNQIKEEILHDPDLLHVLHYAPLLGTEDEDNGDKYFEKCIFGYMRLPDLKSDVRNFLCYEIEEQHGSNDLVEILITFRCICHKDDLETDWGVPRVDLLSAIVNKHFTWSNKYSNSFVKKAEAAYVANNEYNVREISYLVTSSNGTFFKVNGRRTGSFR